MKELIKSSRRQIDSLLEVLKNNVSSREYYKGYDNLQLGFMRLGIVLGELGEVNPYPESTNPDSKIIEPPADKSESSFEIPDGIDEIGFVKLIRQQIDNILLELNNKFNSNKHWADIPLYYHKVFIAMDSLRDAKMWYGQVLNNIRLAEINYQAFIKENENLMKKQVLDAYDRYGSVTDYKNFQGNPMPKFDELPVKIQEAWFAAVQPFDRSINQKNVAGSNIERFFHL